MTTPKKPFKTRAKYSKPLTQIICQYLRQGLSVDSITKIPGMPSSACYYKWVHKHEAFKNLVYQAKDIGCIAMADDILDIADNATNDWMTIENKYGKKRQLFNPESVARSKVRIDSRKWLLSKLMPKKFGDHIRLEHDASEDMMALMKAGRERAYKKNS